MDSYQTEKRYKFSPWTSNGYQFVIIIGHIQNHTPHTTCHMQEKRRKERKWNEMMKCDSQLEMHTNTEIENCKLSKSLTVWNGNRRNIFARRTIWKDRRSINLKLYVSLRFGIAVCLCSSYLFECSAQMNGQWAPVCTRICICEE